MHLQKVLLYCLILLSVCSLSNAQEFQPAGQVSFWLNLHQQETNSCQLGLRFIPEFSYAKQISDNFIFDAGVSAKMFGTGDFESGTKPDYDSDISLYRLSSRISGQQYELRLGLQKINFGSASVFRPLMWFDKVDPRDPLQLTSGVYGLLGRFYLLNNANAWLWGLLGNKDPKGWELFSTPKDKPELGGRLQIPVLSGEAGVSYHHRKLDLSGVLPVIPPGVKTSTSENRIAFDGKWDIELGFWLETSLTHHASELMLYDWERAYTVGMDYTFEIGNGLNLLTEYFVLENTNDILKADEGIRFSALSANYPLNLTDKVSGIVYYDWENHDSYSVLNIQRNYDNWSYHLFAFWNPDENKLNLSSRDSSEFAGKGMQFMVVFNY